MTEFGGEFIAQKRHIALEGYFVSHFLKSWTLAFGITIRSGVSTERFAVRRLPNHTDTSLTALWAMINWRLARKKSSDESFDWSTSSVIST